jgi:uncharacterized protein DUF4124
MRVSLLWVGLLLPITASGAIYKWVDPEGRVFYSDKPHAGAQELDLPPINIYSPFPQPPTTPALEANETKQAPAYSRLNVIAPSPDAVIYNSNRTVAVELLLDGPLNEKVGDRIIVLLDGKPSGQPSTGLQLALHDVERGTHSLQAQVQDARGRVLVSSPVVTFHLQQMSLFYPSNPLNPPPQRPSPTPR